LTLIKSTLSNLPTYYLSLFPIPMGVEAKYDSLSGDCCSKEAARPFGVGMFSRDILDMKWEMDQIFVSGMMLGVGINH
jgi:hypothetical protein